MRSDAISDSNGRWAHEPKLSPPIFSPPSHPFVLLLEISPSTHRSVSSLPPASSSDFALPASSSLLEPPPCPNSCLSCYNEMYRPVPTVYEPRPHPGGLFNYKFRRLIGLFLPSVPLSFSFSVFHPTLSSLCLFLAFPYRRPFGRHVGSYKLLRPSHSVALIPSAV